MMQKYKEHVNCQSTDMRVPVKSSLHIVQTSASCVMYLTRILMRLFCATVYVRNLRNKGT